ncbi:MAG: DUF563 domain-containing protein [Oscillatoriales cyanobacterium RM2_1_1]|nr:DUF563 domain-containing protein [Oscillatoriales cyanobacterium SM2_3_0]NJO44236.1 DUF563 domain-containing protein [Oscillatoriales cyanobacterium RM2_1_1]
MGPEQLLQIATAYLSQGNSARALNICQQVLNHDPNSAPGHQLLGNLYETQEQWTAAQHAYIKAIELQPLWPEPYAYLARLYRNIGWLDEAISFYRKAFSLYHQSPPELYYSLGEALQFKGEFAEAIHHYQQATTLRPDYVLPYLGWAIVLSDQGKTPQAIELLEQTLGQIPEAPEIHNTLGCLLLRQEHLAAAQTVLEQGLTLKPDWAILHNNLGQVFGAQGKVGRAIAAYQAAIELQPDLIMAYINLAKIWQQQNQHDLGIAYLQKVLELDPKNILAYSDCASSLLSQGQFISALICLRQAINLDAKFVAAYIQRFGSIVLDEMSQDDSQDELLLAQVTCAQFLQGLTQVDFSEYSNVDSRSSSTLESVTSHLCQLLGKAYFHLGNTLMQYGEFESAIRYYQKALRVQPKSLETYWRLGYCAWRHHRQNIALTVVHLAQTLTKNTQEFSGEVYLLIGLILEQQNRGDLATEYYAKVLDHFHRRQPKLTIHPLILRWLNRDTITTQTPDLKPKAICLKTYDWLHAQQLETTHYTVIDLPPDSRLVLLISDSGSILDSSLDSSNESAIAPEKASQSSEIECQGLDCLPCLRRIYQQLELVNSGHGIQTCSRQSVKESFQESGEFPGFVAQIPQGRAWIVSQENYWMVCKAIAIITPDNQLLADVSREYPGQLPGCQKYQPQNHRIFREPDLPELTLIDGNVAVLSGLSGQIYFHWMVDVLPRIELLRRSGIFEQIEWFLVNSIHLDFQQETLNQLGISTDQILTSDRHPHLQAKNLVVPAFAAPLGWLKPWGIEFLRGSFLTSINLRSAHVSERIYISRGDARHRRVINEIEVMEVLQQYGFVSVQLESLTFSQQVALFAQANVIVAPHGSGLTNLVFCQPDTQVIELVSPHYQRHYYWVISQFLNLEHYSLTGEGFSCYPLRNLMYQNPLTEDIWVNLTALRILLGKIGVD